jgi:hypothetical protein
MKQALGLCLMLSLTALGAGCVSNRGSGNIQPASNQTQNCNVLDYGIREFSLLASMPIISQSYDLNLVFERLGDCEAQNISVSLFEDDRFLRQYSFSDIKNGVGHKINWTPKSDGKVALRVELELMDADLDNNKETIFISANPLGNYLRITDLSAEKFSVNSPLAELFELSAPINITSADVYLAKAESASSEITVNLKIQKDINNSPGQILFNSRQTILLKEQFDWFAFKVNQEFEAGKYWLTLESEGSGAIWHCSRKSLGGAKYESAPVYYESNSSSLMFSGAGWEILPQKDFTFKIRAQNSVE